MTQTTPCRRGRPLAHIDANMLGTLGWMGLRLEDAAKALGVSRQCLHGRFKRDSELREAYRTGAADFRSRTMAEAADAIAATAFVMGAVRAARAASAVQSYDGPLWPLSGPCGHLAAANHRCYIRGMPKSATGQASAIAAYENFCYLLAEIEASIARGDIHWSAESVQAAQRRLANALADLCVIAVRLRDADAARPTDALH